jgi:hypothetical protein
MVNFKITVRNVVFQDNYDLYTDSSMYVHDGVIQ